MSKNCKRINATVGVLTTLAMGASMMAGPMAALASGQADQGAEPQSAPEAKGSATVHSGLVKTAAIGTFSFDQTYVSPTADVARLQGVAQVACGGANASSQVRSADWQLTVSGDVDNAFCATIGELVEDESTPQLMTCSCGGNPAGGRAIVNAEVGGVSIESLLVASQAQKGVNTVTFIADDGTQVSVPLSYAIGRHAVLGCEVNGEDIANSVGSANQLWMAKTPANYFLKNVVEVVFTVEDEVPVAPVAANPASPNVGVLTGTQA